MQKLLIAILIGGLLFTGSVLLLDKVETVVNGPVPADVQRDSLRKRFARAIANWMIDKGMRDAPPQEIYPPRSLAIYTPPVSEQLIQEGGNLNHAEGW